MTKEEVLNSIHILTRTSSDDELIHNLLVEIYDLGLNAINSKLNKRVIEIPEELSHILKKYILFQYQKLDAEGQTANKVDVLSSTYLTDDGFLNQFENEFDKYNDKGNLGNGKFLNVYR